MSVVGAHSVGREWAGLILAIFWAKDDPGDLLGLRVVPMLSHPDSVGAARPLGGSFGGHLWSCPSGPTSLISRATSRLPCVALASRTAHPVRGVLPRLGRGRPVTLAGVMRRCAEATIITVGEATSVDAPSYSVAGPVRAALSLCQGVLQTLPTPQDKESWRRGACTGSVLADTPVRGSGVHGAHVPGNPAWL